VLRSASREEQVAYFARLMPDTTIGRHAVQHIEQALEWHVRREQWNASRRGAPERSPLVAETECQVRAILEAGLHGTLNTELRRLVDRQSMRPRVDPVPRRLLLGSYDVEAFSVEVARHHAVREVIAAVAAAA
jgi:hypothetical protein